MPSSALCSGSLATQIGREAAFAGAAALGIVLAAVVVSTPHGAGALAGAGSPPSAILRDRRFRFALWLTLMPSICFGVVEVLVPLRLDVLGATALAIGLIFFVAAFFEALVSPVVGRIADRRGALVDRARRHDRRGGMSRAARAARERRRAGGRADGRVRGARLALGPRRDARVRARRDARRRPGLGVRVQQRRVGRRGRDRLGGRRRRWPRRAATGCPTGSPRCCALRPGLRRWHYRPGRALRSSA